MTVAVLGAGLAGCCTALELADRGQDVVLFERNSQPMTEASKWGEGKIHQGFVYANDTSFQTAKTMLDGAAVFGPILSRWININKIGKSIHGSFNYAVPTDSLLSVSQIETHFFEVRKYASELMQKEGVDFIGTNGTPDFSSVPVHSGTYDPNLIEACFETTEIAVDTHLLSNLIQEAVVAHPKIELRLNTKVDRLSGDAGHYAVHVINEDGVESSAVFSDIVNALWANRLLIDSTLGLKPQRTWMNRLKLGLNVSPTDNGVKPWSCDLPNTTFVLGPYGDIVRFASGRTYISWYAAGMFGVLNDMTEFNWREQFKHVNKVRVVRETIEMLKQLMPGLNVAIDDDTDIVVEGGAIFAWGKSDIDQIDSELHLRYDIGPVCYDRLISLDSGKLTTAPQFAIQAADMLFPKTKSVQV